MGWCDASTAPAAVTTRKPRPRGGSLVLRGPSKDLNRSPSSCGTSAAGARRPNRIPDVGGRASRWFPIGRRPTPRHEAAGTARRSIVMRAAPAGRFPRPPGTFQRSEPVPVVLRDLRRGRSQAQPDARRRGHGFLMGREDRFKILKALEDERTPPKHRGAPPVSERSTRHGSVDRGGVTANPSPGGPFVVVRIRGPGRGRG